MKTTILLVHADRAPEFHEPKVAAARYLLPSETGDPRMPGELTYEYLGRVRVGLESDEEGIEPAAYAEVRTFGHPDLIEAIKEHGARREANGIFSGAWE